MVHPVKIGYIKISCNEYFIYTMIFIFVIVYINLIFGTFSLSPWNDCYFPFFYEL